ncbi:hypothetical protein CR513_08022, partial [Mucuna pruriens]
MNNITANNYLSFSKDKIPIEGKEHNQPLHIAVKCGSYIASSIAIRAFNGSKRKVMREITLPIRIEPVTIDITFQLFAGPTMDPLARAIPFPLHQKVKFIMNQKLIRVSGKRDLMISTRHLLNT